MARKLVLSGPAAEAVERLARSARVSPAELIRRALRREDEAQRDGAESRVNPASQPARAPLRTTTATDHEAMAADWKAADPYPYPAPENIFTDSPVLPGGYFSAELLRAAGIAVPESPEPASSGGSETEHRRVRVFDVAGLSEVTAASNIRVEAPDIVFQTALETSSAIPDTYTTIETKGIHTSAGPAEALSSVTARPGEVIGIPASSGNIQYLWVQPSPDGSRIRVSWIGHGPQPAEPGDPAEVPSSAIKPGKPGERG